ncbi:hypothetical protein QSJ18_16015 [Gordonia sp. ABSL1-1]|uniref:hypothetical protein n=1 Tax=Gordonia sp. ABSL1-1 TaxID=3053923 RepID=UPI0025731665|nr:hypothetical protein [Gordonia sp. ABSL1-1]MDL9938259.1 hypothetical protein [Gordonia sp. ABSL1-1]
MSAPRPPERPTRIAPAPGSDPVRLPPVRRPGPPPGVPPRPGPGGPPPRRGTPGPGGPVRGGDLTDELINTDFWTDQMVESAGIPIVDVPFVTVGSGIGSFVTVDYLRISGVPIDRIAILGPQDVPWHSYEYLTRVSQIPRTERLRSDSASTPDNIWGFPSYAVREAWREKKLGPLWNVLVEPEFANFYTPKAGHAFESMERECQRIGYLQSLHRGQVRMIRRRAAGGYFTILTPTPGSAPTKRVAFRSQWVHVAIGYPGIKLLPDLQAFREKYRDASKVVNAYEPHEHIYQSLQRKPGTVMIRGAGIVASRVLQRLIDDRDRLGLQTQIVHLFRTYVDKSHGPHIFMRRKGKDGWAYQGFNYPKSVWGGQLKERMRKLEGHERAAAYKEMGGTNTPVRDNWQEQLRRGRAEGWYQVAVGKAESLVPAPGGQGVMTTVRVDPHAPIAQTPRPDGTFELFADYVIDCTGLEADVREHRLLADLLDHTGAGLNPVGRMDVERDFELRGTRSGGGKIYASGSATLGGYFPGVDTFLGLQIAAQEIADDLVRQGFCKKLGPMRSFRQWWRWVNHKGVD